MAKEKTKKGGKLKWILIIFVVLVIIGSIEVKKSDEKAVSKEASSKNVEETTNSVQEKKENSQPEPNTSAMVDSILLSAKSKIENGIDESLRDEALNAIASAYPDFFKDNTTMENLMYHGAILEYGFEGNTENDVYYNLGMDTVQAIKYVYRNAETPEDDATKENLRQVSESLLALGVISSDTSDNSENADDSIPTEYKSALSKAESYSETMYMSKQGIYEQLTSEYGEKFSADAAQYAIDNMTADWNANALKKAESYCETMYMSKQGVYDQLVSENGEKFTEEESQYAIDNLEWDWKANALEKAKSYQKTMSMSPEAIREQLTSEYGEKFTPEEADYAISNLG